MLVLHALTGDAHVVGPAGPGQPTPGWWDGLIGAGRALDPNEWWVVASNVLGGCQGSTGPSSPAPDGRAWGSRFPRITIRDQVAAERRLADELEIGRFAAVIGGSMGGMRALEWVITHPDRVDAALGARGRRLRDSRSDRDPDRSADRDSVRPALARRRLLRTWATDPADGLGLARRIAHLTYRSELELETRFGRSPQGGEDPLRGGRFAVQSYLDHHAEKLVGRFDAGTYVALTDAMNTHDVGRGRGGVAAALAGITSRVVVAGIDSDRLYPIRLQQELADLIPTCPGLEVVRSPYGHDGFLIEIEAVSELVRQALTR